MNNNQNTNSNMNNQFNSSPNNISNNQNNLYSTNTTKQVAGNNNKLKFVIIGIILIIVAIIVVVLLKGGNGFSIGTHKNTTGSNEYKGSDVDYNCTYKYSKDNNNGNIYSDLIFDYESIGSDGVKYNYQLVQYNKMVLEYKDGLSDSKYKEFVDSFESLECLGFGDEEKCTESHLELGITKQGWDTVIDRKGNTIIVTYYNIYGMGVKATKEDIKKIIESFEEQGYVCK